MNDVFKHNKGEFKKGCVPWSKGKHIWKDRKHPMLGRHHTEETKKRLSKANPKVSESLRRSYDEGKIKSYWKGKHRSEEQKLKQSKSMKKKYDEEELKPYWKGKHRSEESKNKNSETHKMMFVNGYVHPMLGKHHSEESKRKIGKANSNPSEETRRLLRKARMRQVCPFKDTSIELKIQKGLLEKGVVFEKHKALRGQPDIFIKPNICVFADGDFWHKYPNGREHDRRVTEDLQKQGFIVLRLWEHEINDNVDLCINKIIEAINK